MIADRISAKYIYDSLKVLGGIYGGIENIRVKRKDHYGSKSVPKFNNIEEYKKFIDDLYPYKSPNSCECATKNEGIYILISFSFNIDGSLVNIHNGGNGFKSSKTNLINEASLKLLNESIFLTKELTTLFDKYVCFPYMEFGYTECDYIEMVSNEQYDRLIELYKKNK